MREPHELNDPPGDPDAPFEARLRNVRPASPRLDRDRLMFLAGQRSITKPATSARRARLWPFVAVASWAACAALAGLLVTRPLKVVVETRIVERIVKAPAQQAQPPKGPETAVAESLPVNESSSADPDPLSLGPLDGPLTILSSRPSYRPLKEPLAVAELPMTSADAVPPSSPPTYGELRRELLPDRSAAPTAGLFHWF